MKRPLCKCTHPWDCSWATEQSSGRKTENETKGEEVEVSTLGHKTLLPVTEKALATKLRTLYETTKIKLYRCPHVMGYTPHSLLQVIFYNKLLDQLQSKLLFSTAPFLGTVLPLPRSATCRPSQGPSFAVLASSNAQLRPVAWWRYLPKSDCSCEGKSLSARDGRSCYRARLLP